MSWRGILRCVQFNWRVGDLQAVVNHRRWMNLFLPHECPLDVWAEVNRYLERGVSREIGIRFGNYALGLGSTIDNPLLPVSECTRRVSLASDDYHTPKVNLEREGGSNVVEMTIFGLSSFPDRASLEFVTVIPELAWSIYENGPRKSSGSGTELLAAL